jgi:predicted transposase YbfD/YdcC
MGSLGLLPSCLLYRSLIIFLPSRSHWSIEKRQHWGLDFVFQDDLSRLRTGSGSQNMAIIKRTALNMIRSAGYKQSQ